MNCLNPITLFSVDRAKYPDGLDVPCGKCMACRMTKRKEWSLRMLHELKYHNDASFVTLTYDDNHIPDCQSLVKADLQKFFKRLRKSIAPRKIRYFACGEYGRKTGRPHYHAILYNNGLSPEHITSVMRSWTYCDWNNSAICRGSFAPVTPASINYVAGYIQDKLDGELAHEVYTLSGREPVFRLSSKGIGRDYADQYIDKLTTDQYVTVNGCKVALPRYYVKRCNIELDPSRRDDVDCDLTEYRTGVHARFLDLYKSSDESIFLYVDKELESRRQKRRELQHLLDVKHSKL